METATASQMEAALAPEQIAEVAKGNVQSIASEPVPVNSESDEDMPLSQRALKVQKVLDLPRHSSTLSKLELGISRKHASWQAEPLLNL